MSRKMLRTVEKRGVHAARNGPSEDSKCWQRLELGIHGLKSWDRNWSRKVRETRSSSSQKWPEHCSVSTTSVNRRGQPSMPCAELGTALPTRQGSLCYGMLRYSLPAEVR